MQLWVGLYHDFGGALSLLSDLTRVMFARTANVFGKFSLCGSLSRLPLAGSVNFGGRLAGGVNAAGGKGKDERRNRVGCKLGCKRKCFIGG